MENKERSKNLKKTILASALAVTIAGTVLTAFSGVFNKDEDEIDLKSEIAKINTAQSMYDVMLKFATTTKLPTLFDNKGKPIQSVSISSFVGEDGKPEENTDLMLNVIYQNEEKHQTYGYTVLTDSSEYEFAKNHGKLADIENGKEIYIHEGNYFWKDDDTQLFSSLAAYDYDSKGPDAKELNEILLSIGQSKLDIRKYIPFKAGKDLVVPTYTMNGKNLPYSMVLDYNAETKDGQASSMVAMHYSDFILTASNTDDFTLNANIAPTRKKYEQERFNDRIVYIDKASDLIYFTGDDTSVIIQSNLEKSTDELVKVLKSMKFNTLK